MALKEMTSDLHRACEAHPVGQLLVKGNVTRQQWADWLWALRCLHQVVDLALPGHMHRDALFAADLSVLPRVNPSPAALRFGLSLLGGHVTGAAYVLHGAHRSGGQVLAPLMAKRGFPNAHIAYADPDAARAWIDHARLQSQFAQQARDTFACLLAVMDEIAERS